MVLAGVVCFILLLPEDVKKIVDARREKIRKAKYGDVELSENIKERFSDVLGID